MTCDAVGWQEDLLWAMANQSILAETLATLQQQWMDAQLSIAVHVGVELNQDAPTPCCP